MGKTIRLTEEQICRFFGEGFGKRLIGEGIDPQEDGENMSGRAPHQGFLNKSRVEFVGGQNKQKQNGGPEEDDKEMAASNFKNMAIASMRGLGKTKFDYGTMFSDKQRNGINEVLNIIFDMRDGSPINILDLLEILHQKIPNKRKTENYTEEETKILKILDGISIDYLLSGFVGLDAPDYVYHRLKNLTAQDIARIKSKFGKDFKGWGKICDGCGGRVWNTTVPTAEHDEGYTTFDFAATDTSNAGHFVKESAGFSGGTNPRKIPFSDIMQIHHINGDPGNNSAWNLACLCPNCHASIDSTGRGRETVFSVESIMGNGDIKGGSINSRLRSDEIERIERTIVDRINHGYFSDKTVASMILNGGKQVPYASVDGKQKDTWAEDIAELKLPDNIIFPGYARRFINPMEFRKSLKSLLKNAISFAREYRNKDKFNNLLIKNNVMEEKELGNDGNKEIILSTANGKPIKLSYSLSYDGEKGNVLLKINRPQKGKTKDKKLIPPKVITINGFGAVDGDYRQKSNIVDEIIFACVSLVNEMIPNLAVNYRDIGQTVASDNELFAVTNDEKAEAEHSMNKANHPNQKTVYPENDIKFFLNAYKLGNSIAIENSIKGMPPSERNKDGLPAHPLFKKLKELLDNGVPVVDALIQSGVCPGEERAKKFATNK